MLPCSCFFCHKVLKGVVVPYVDVIYRTLEKYLGGFHCIYSFSVSPGFEYTKSTYSLCKMEVLGGGFIMCFRPMLALFPEQQMSSDDF